MGLEGKASAPEDVLCARYIKSLVERTSLDMEAELKTLRHTESGEKFFRPETQQVFPAEDYQLCTDVEMCIRDRVFHVPIDEVTPQQRRNAKAVNFGIVYGISSFGLSQDLSISTKEAKEYIERYFETYPGIKSYLDGLVEHAKEEGYVTTMYGRRRPVPELKSSNFMQRSFGAVSYTHLLYEGFLKGKEHELLHNHEFCSS